MARPPGRSVAPGPRSKPGPRAAAAHSGRLLSHSDAMTVNHLPAFPACEKQDQHDDKGQNHSCRNDGFFSMLIARIPVVELDYDRNDVSSGVHPCVRKVADSIITQN